MIPITPGMLRIGAWVLVALSLFGFGYYQGSRNGAVKVSQCEASHATYVAKVAEDNAAIAALYWKKEQAVADDFAKIAAQNADKLAEVSRETKESVLADVRAGRVRVRLPSCPRVPASSETADGAVVDHGEADSGDEATRIVAGAIGIGAEADARLQACQALLTAERK